MAKNNELVQFAGHFQSLATELSVRAAKRGGNIVREVSMLVQPANARALDEIDVILGKISNTFRVKIGGRRDIAEVVEGSGYTGYDGSIVERCAIQKGRERWAVVEIFDMEHLDHDPSDAEVEAEYVRLGLGRPDVDHAVHFGEQFQHLPVEGHPIVFYLQKPVPGAGGCRCVLGLLRAGVGRGLHWDWLIPSNRCSRDYRFAGVRE